jgi:PAS domain S-box-containing protein
MNRQPTPTGRERQLREEDFIVSKTDTKGIIKYGNQVFIEYSGYSEKELLGANHNIIRHPDMPRCVFKLLWDTLSEKREVFAFVKNLSKDGSHYWVLANITPSFDASGKTVVGYFSVRRKPRPESVRAISAVYERLLAEERRIEAGSASRRKESIAASTALFHDILRQEGKSYDEYVLSL